jgi:hypothetical protein
VPDLTDSLFTCRACGEIQPLEPGEINAKPSNRIPIALLAMLAVLAMITAVRVIQTRAIATAAEVQAAE